MKELFFFGSRDNYLYAVDSGIGKEKWRFKTGGDVPSCPLVIDGKVYFGSYDGYFYCLDEEDGTEIWRFKTGAELFNVNPPILVKGIIFFR